jgi:hypothetical protein
MLGLNGGFPLTVRIGVLAGVFAVVRAVLLDDCGAVIRGWLPRSLRRRRQLRGTEPLLRK